MVIKTEVKPIPPKNLEKYKKILEKRKPKENEK